MVEWRNGRYVRGGVRNEDYLEQRNAVPDYPSGGGIWNSTIAEFGMKLYLRAEFGIQDHTRNRNEKIIKGSTRTECKIFRVAREELPRIDNYL